MNRSRVVLVQPPIEDFYLTKKRTLPYGLASIAACVREKGFEVEILDSLATDKSKPIDYPEEFQYLKAFYGRKDISSFSLFHEFRHFGYSHEYIGTQIREKQPFVVGISALFTAYWDQALKTATTIKKFYPQCKIVLGGHHPTLFPEKSLNCPAIDFVLQGEGETSMGLLCQALRNGSDIKDIPGIAFQKKDASFFISAPFWLKDFSSLPLPAVDLFNHDFYQRKKRGSTMVVSSRGCPMQCSYCSVSASSFHAPFRQRRVEDVIREISFQIKNHDIGFIDFEDENLCLNKKWFVSLFSNLKHLSPEKRIELRAMNGLYPPSIDEQVISLMKESGFKTLNLSLGSTSKAQLKKFKRPDVRDSFETSLKLAQKYGLECVSYIIAAAPEQTAQSSLDDLLYLAEKRTLVGLSIFYPAPGSLDYEKCQEKNMLPRTFSRMRSTALPLNNITSRVEAVTLLRLSRILNFLKAIVDIEGALPVPRSFPGHSRTSFSNRQALSKTLVQWFLKDGIIRGVDANGQIYTHTADTVLAQQFCKKIKTLSIAGIK